MPIKPRSLAERFWEKVEPTGFCWGWAGSIDAYGYGRLSIKTPRGWRDGKAHRLAYELLVGPIPHGLDIDHLCRMKHCVNPDHLQPVTRGENTRRHYSLRTHCKSGHRWTPESTYVKPNGTRMCRLCKNERRRKHDG